MIPMSHNNNKKLMFGAREIVEFALCEAGLVSILENPYG